MKERLIVVGADEFGLPLKKDIREHLKLKGYTVVDYGVNGCESTMYPDVALAVASAVANHEFPQGILLCGTGIGMCITANKVPGVRAAVCHDPFSAERSRASNDCQILALGAQVISPEKARKLVDVWLKTEFRHGRSTPKVRRIMEIDGSSPDASTFSWSPAKAPPNPEKQKPFGYG